MRELYHWPLDPNSRQARIALAEKKLKFRLVAATPWHADQVLEKLSIEARPPCLIEAFSGQTQVIVGARAICEYAHEVNTDNPLLSDQLFERAEARRLCVWFERHFTDEVNAYILYEKLEKTFTTQATPDNQALSVGRTQLIYHLNYINALSKTRSWLAGEMFSLADIAAGAHISCLDYLGEISWGNYPQLHGWYHKFKSRPSVRPLLADRVAGFIPPAHYADLDF